MTPYEKHIARVFVIIGAVCGVTFALFAVGLIDALTKIVALSR